MTQCNPLFAFTVIVSDYVQLIKMLVLGNKDRTYAKNSPNLDFTVGAIHVDAERLPAGYCPYHVSALRHYGVSIERWKEWGEDRQYY
ncbi:hypothetical protein KBT16_09810 [Nostoc sp. CCCryo 231-06]|nr:hypothetical protein [Nostoc sp. CCCryo 231-06]